MLIRSVGVDVSSDPCFVSFNAPPFAALHCVKRYRCHLLLCVNLFRKFGLGDSLTRPLIHSCALTPILPQIFAFPFWQFLTGGWGGENTLGFNPTGEVPGGGRGYFSTCSRVLRWVCGSRGQTLGRGWVHTLRGLEKTPVGNVMFFHGHCEVGPFNTTVFGGCCRYTVFLACHPS